VRICFRTRSSLRIRVDSASKFRRTRTETSTQDARHAGHVRTISGRGHRFVWWFLFCQRATGELDVEDGEATWRESELWSARAGWVAELIPQDGKRERRLNDAGGYRCLRQSHRPNLWPGDTFCITGCMMFASEHHFGGPKPAYVRTPLLFRHRQLQQNMPPE
jgi:hypothetical protein